MLRYKRQLTKISTLTYYNLPLLNWFTREKNACMWNLNRHQLIWLFSSFELFECSYPILFEFKKKSLTTHSREHMENALVAFLICNFDSKLLSCVFHIENVFFFISSMFLDCWAILMRPILNVVCLRYVSQAWQMYHLPWKKNPWIYPMRSLTSRIITFFSSHLSFIFSLFSILRGPLKDRVRSFRHHQWNVHSAFVPEDYYFMFPSFLVI